MSKALYRFYWDTYYANVEGVFVADPAAVAAAMGQQVHLGEAEGKHSECYGPLEADDVTLLTEDPAFIAQFEAMLPHGVGYNPLHYLG